MSFVTRADIGLTADYESLPLDRAIDKTFVHWGGTPVRDSAAKGHRAGEKAQLRDWEQYHLSKGWSGIAYDYAVGVSGDVYELRANRRSAAQSGDLERDGIRENIEGNAVVCIIGEGQRPSTEMIQALLGLFEWLDVPVYGHREVNELSGTGTATSCPGADLMYVVESYRSGAVTADGSGFEVFDQEQEDEPEAPAVDEGFDVTKLPTVRKGDEGRKVKAVQGLVNATGLARTRVDGSFGPLTDAAVRKFQTRCKLGVDGVVGPETWGELLELDA